MNHRSSSATPRQKTRFVVRRGKEVRRSKRMWVPNLPMVPVPVLSPLRTPVSRMSRIRFKYWYSACCWFADPACARLGATVCRRARLLTKTWNSYLIAFSSLMQLSGSPSASSRTHSRQPPARRERFPPCTALAYHHPLTRIPLKARWQLCRDEGVALVRAVHQRPIHLPQETNPHHGAASHPRTLPAQRHSKQLALGAGRLALHQLLHSLTLHRRSRPRACLYTSAPPITKH
jgi:hypothetical protein